jgi:glycosyltransferase involved in cell wall biosynthesis
VVYSISSGVGEGRPDIAFLASLAAIAVADERSLNRLKTWGLDNVFLVRSGIDTSRFSFSPLPLGAEIRLMVASAPWTTAQFRSKGIEALLEAACLNRQLQLIFLWRGILVEEMERRIRQLGLEGQVSVINSVVNVNEVLANVHASVALAVGPGIIKSYPHSLLDSLAAGKPVLTSRAIPMSDYVEQVGCGQVIERVTAQDILAGIEALRKNYVARQEAAGRVGQRDFSHQSMVASFQKVYEQARQKG